MFPAPAGKRKGTTVDNILAFLLSCLLSLVGAKAHAQEEMVGQPDVNALRAAASDYVAAYDKDGKRTKAWERKIKGHIETRISDKGDSEEKACKEIAYDWLAGSEARLRQRNPDAVLTACLWFKFLVDKNFGLPLQVMQRLTKADCAQLVEFLKEQVARAEPVASK